MKLKFVLIVLFLLFSCGKSSEQTSESRDESFASRKASPAPSSVVEESSLSISGEVSGTQREQKPENQLGKVFSPINITIERLLEYDIQLSYHSTDLIKTRKELLDFISKYGYLESSSAVNSGSPFMTVTMHITSNKLYEALQELDKMGILLSEDIRTTDHTEGMAWQKRKTTREKLRQQRRLNANNQITAGAKNWQQVEESISESEDQLDLAEQEAWKINDKVKWATIHVSYTTPIPPDSIQVPAYRNAFVGLINAFLELTYYLIWILPFAILIGLAFYYIQKIMIKFRRKGER